MEPGFDFTTKWNAPMKRVGHPVTITKQTVAEKFASYLRHDISPTELVSWAEDTMMDGEIDEN
jgi:hypothetical protein